MCSDISFLGLEGLSVEGQLDAGKQHGGKRKIPWENCRPGQPLPWGCACWVGILQVKRGRGASGGLRQAHLEARKREGQSKDGD